jgi:radical SAM superfamily enzyme YgiQ (UPF0313 family)
MKDFKIALIRAFSQSEYKEPSEPLGIEALAAMLFRYDFSCKLFDREKNSQDEIFSEILNYRPDVIGLSVLMDDNAVDALRIIARLRPQLPAAVFVVGGLFVTTNFEKARACFPSYCKLISGEGEIPLARLCCELSGKNFFFEKKILHPDEWPWLYRHNLKDYIADGAPINMRASRGCPGRCKFCATPSMPDGLNKWQPRLVKNIADEMEFLCEKYSPHAFNFIDDDFGPISRVEEFTNELKKRKMRCALVMQLRADAIVKVPNLAEKSRELYDGGLCRVFIGLESFDEKTLAWFNKPLDPHKTLDAFLAMKSAGIIVHIGYILWHPLATEESVRREASALRNAGFFTTKIVMGKLHSFSGCGLHSEPEEKIHLNSKMENYYNSVAQKIAHVYDAWLVGALYVPRWYCLAWLERGGTAAKIVAEIESLLCELDEISFSVLMNPADVADEIIFKKAADVKERLYEIGCTFNRRG